MILAKFLYDNMYSVEETDNPDVIKQLQADGHLICDIRTPLPKDKSLYTRKSMALNLNEETGRYDLHYHTNSDEVILDRIEALKAQLAASDYKIIKMLEYSMLPASLDSDSDVPMPPYDIETLHAERQEIRNEINRLEQLLNNNGI